MSSTQAAGERRQYLEFVLGGGGFGVDILKVKELLQHEDVTPVPSVPRSIRGVINLRGNVVPVVDLAIKCGLPESPVTKRSCILVVETVVEGTISVMGLKTDSVSQVVDLSADDIEAPPAFGTNVRVDYLVGLAKVDGRLILLLDIDRLLSAEDRDVARFAPGILASEAGGAGEAPQHDGAGAPPGPAIAASSAENPAP